MSDDVEKQLLEKIDLARRTALKKLLLGAAYSVPVVASFAMSGLNNVAMATGNLSPTVPTLTEWAVPAFGAALGVAAVAALKKSGEDA
jgi:hypothetical protein